MFSASRNAKMNWTIYLIPASVWDSIAESVADTLALAVFVIILTVLSLLTDDILTGIWWENSKMNNKPKIGLYVLIALMFWS
jgi:hypothetical protein